MNEKWVWVDMSPPFVFIDPQIGEWMTPDRKIIRRRTESGFSYHLPETVNAVSFSTLEGAKHAAGIRA